MKKTALIRLLVLLLAVLTCGSVFASCGQTDDPQPKEGEEDPSGEGDRETEEFLTLIESGKSKCTIIFPGGNDGIAKIANALSSTLSEYFGDLPDFDRDDFTDPDPDAVEILVGNTNRPESREAFRYAYGANDLFVGVVGNKLCLFGLTETSTNNAVKYFTNHYLKTQEKSEAGTFSVPSSLCYSVRARYAVGEVTLMGNRLSDYSIVYPKNSLNAENFYACYLNYYLGVSAGAMLPLSTQSVADEAEIVFETGSPANTFTVTAEGKKLFVRGNDMIDFDEAATYLKKELFPIGAQEVVIPADFSYTGSTAEKHVKKGDYRLIYHNIDGVEAAWNRNDYFRAFYRAYDPDFIGLNEYWFSLSSSPKLPGYLRELGYTEAVPDGLSAPNVQPVWYKADKFDLIEVKYVDYTNGRNAEDASKAATIAVFKEKSTEKNVIVCSTHLASAYKDATSFYTQAEATVFRIEQVDTLHPALDAMSLKYGDCPILIGGDHNADFTDCRSTDPNDYSACKPAAGKTFTDYPRAGALLYILSLGYESARDLAAEKNNACSCHALPAFNETYGIATAENGFFANETANDFSMSIDHSFVRNAEKLTVGYYRTVDDILVYAMSDHSPQIVEFSLK